MSNIANALATPTDYVDVSFNAVANTPYTFWLRTQSTNNSKSSDSVWVQFSDGQANGSTAYAINTTSGLLVNLATDSTGASDQNWGDGSTRLLAGAGRDSDVSNNRAAYAQDATTRVRCRVRSDRAEPDNVLQRVGFVPEQVRRRARHAVE
jgi:hypothetical protein